ncbi:hypothetical protein AB7X11_13495 [Providencia alcalifaciens]
MFQYRAINKQDNTVMYNDISINMLTLINEENLKNSSKKIKNGKYKIANIENDEFFIDVITDEKDYIKSKRMMDREISLIESSVKRISESYELAKKEINAHANRLIHNLTTINGQNLQYVYSVISQSFFERKNESSTADWLNLMNEEVSSKVDKATTSLMRIAKNSMQFKNEINIYNALLNNDFKLRIINHNIHKVLMNAFYVFFPDFTDASIKVKIHKTNIHVKLDYDTFQVAIYHIIENAVKYTKPHSELNVTAYEEENEIKIKFSMISLAIDKNEELLIFNEGYSGLEAIKFDKNGSGIGMPRTLQLLKFSNAGITLIAKRDADNETWIGVNYHRNEFIVSLPSK